MRLSLTLAPQPEAMFRDGQKVYVKKGRGMEGPFTVEKRNSDGTYELKDSSSGSIKHNVKERDIEDD